MNLLIFMVLLTADISSAGIVVVNTYSSSFTLKISKENNISITENNRTLQCKWNTTQCYVQCTFANVTTNLSSLQGWDLHIIEEHAKELAINTSYADTICNVTLCDKNAILIQMNKLCVKSSDARHLKKLLNIKKMCVDLFTEKNFTVNEYVSAERRCLQTAINIPFEGETKSYDMGELVMDVVKMDKINATNDGLVHMPAPKVIGWNLPLNVQIPMEPFLNVSVNQNKVGIVTYASADQFTTDQSSLSVTAKVIRIEVPGREIKDLSTLLAINFTLEGNETKNSNYSPLCQFFNEEGHEWSTAGSFTSLDYFNSSNIVQCSYNHMTPFAVLLVNLSEIDKQQWVALSYLSYIGCGLSLFFSAASVLIYIFSRKTKGDHSTSIHVSLSAVLCLLNASFLLSEWAATSSHKYVCVFIAVTIQYSLLSSFSWMAIEAIHIYLLLVKVFNTYIKHYMIKLSLFGWGFPAVLVGASLCVYNVMPFYGTQTVQFANTQENAKVCWITEPRFLYGLNITYYSCTFVFNTAIFMVVAFQIFKLRGTAAKKPSGKHISTVLGLTCLLGITWGLAFLSSGYLNYPILYLFCICNSLQGLFLFLWICGTMRKNRAQRVERSTMSDQPSFETKPEEISISQL